MNQRGFQKNLRKYFAHGKPVVITEFGCCTYQGAEKKGGYGWAIVDWKAEPPRLKGEYVRDEGTQAQYLMELIRIFEEEKVEGCFAFTFVMPKYPYSSDPRFDLDMASYGLVKSYADRSGSVYPDMPWDPKEGFHALAGFYGKS